MTLPQTKELFNEEETMSPECNWSLCYLKTLYLNSALELKLCIGTLTSLGL